MAGRPKPVQAFVSETIGDQAIKDKPGILYGVSLSWVNCNIGDRIVIHDSLTATGRKLFEHILPTAAGQFTASIAEVGKEALTGIFLNFQVAAAAGPNDVVVNADYD